MLAESLLGANCEVVEAESGDAAALLVDCPEGFDALVTDIHMPGRLNGLDLGRRFRARHARSPILYMTGQPEAMRGVRLRPHRETVLFKPCGVLALVAILQAMVAKNRQNSQTSSGSYLDRLRAHGKRVGWCASRANV